MPHNLVFHLSTTGAPAPLHVAFCHSFSNVCHTMNILDLHGGIMISRDDDNGLLKIFWWSQNTWCFLWFQVCSKLAPYCHTVPWFFVIINQRGLYCSRNYVAPCMLHCLEWFRVARIVSGSLGLEVSEFPLMVLSLKFSFIRRVYDNCN